METLLILVVAAFLGMLLALIFGGVMGLFLTAAVFALGIIFYFLPTIIAIYRRHPHGIFIFLVNLFLSFTVVGWIVALLWAMDFHKTVADFMEFQKSKKAGCAKDANQNARQDDIIEGEYTKEN